MTIPASVTSIRETTFAYCSSLTSISVDPANVEFRSLDGVLFDRFKTTLIHYPAGLSGSYDIPAGVLFVGDGAFSHCSGLTGITFPASVLDIGWEAFSYCGGLTGFTLPPRVWCIGAAAFSHCTGLTSVTIPAGVGTIVSQPFAYCTNLASILVDPANSYFTSMDGILFSWTLSTLIQYPMARVGDYVIPSSVIFIDDYAFAGSAGLTGVVIPAGVLSIGARVFYGCTGLIKATFMGDASAVFENLIEKESVGPEFRVYYFNGKAGFSTPVWNGFRTVNMGTETPVKIWILAKGLPYDANLSDDSDGDGVNLLMAYALNLNPAPNSSRSWPSPDLSDDEMNLRFFAGSAGVTYKVEASADLLHWSTEGVVLSALDTKQHRTATIARAGLQRFMRLAVSQ